MEMQLVATGDVVEERLQTKEGEAEAAAERMHEQMEEASGGEASETAATRRVRICTTARSTQQKQQVLHLPTSFFVSLFVCLFFSLICALE